MPKDRIADLHKTRNNTENVIVIDNAFHQENEIQNIFDRTKVITDWLNGFEKNMEIIKSDLRKIGTTINNKELYDKLEDLFSNNTSICQQINPKFKQIEQELQKTSNSAEYRIKAIQFNTAKDRYHKLFLQNNNELEHFRDIQKDIIRAQLKAKNVNVQEEELQSLLNEGKDIHLFTENILAETAEAKRLLVDLEERHEQLLKIERMLTEVRDLFVQMSILIENQQDIIDRVEYQAQKAADYIGSVDLKPARKKKCRQLKVNLATFQFPKVQINFPIEYKGWPKPTMCRRRRIKC